MMQPDALLLAERIDGWVHQDDMNIEDAMKAAAELRQLHEAYECNTAIMHARTKRMNELRNQRDELLEALVMVRDADEDCKRDGLPTIPSSARAKIDAAISKAEKT